MGRKEDNNDLRLMVLTFIVGCAFIAIVMNLIIQIARW